MTGQPPLVATLQLGLYDRLGAVGLGSCGSDCPLDLSWPNFTLVASACSNPNDRGGCCRYINVFIAVSISRYTNETGKLGVPAAFSDLCLNSISRTFKFYGIPPNALIFCGLGSKIRVSYECEGRETILEMLESPNFETVKENCQLPFLLENSCKRCLNSGILYLHHLVRPEDNITLSICRNAVFVTLASQGDNLTALDMASCFFGVQGLGLFPGTSARAVAPAASASPLSAQAPAQMLVGLLQQQHPHSLHFHLILGIGIAITCVTISLLAILILLIRKKNKELNSRDYTNENLWNSFSHHLGQKSHEGASSVFRRFSYKEMEKATNNFSTCIGRGGFGSVYRAHFDDGFIAAVKRMDKISIQGEEEFCREMELLGRLHHRHLVSLKGFCVDGHERFLVYEYMENGSLNDHLHSTRGNILGWQTRLQIAMDVANALEYLHFYCDPPLCHRDIKSSNILLDENFVAKVADFGLAHASRNGSVSFEPVNTDIKGTPGYADPEYFVTQELSEKSDVYSYGVLLLELVTGRKAIQDKRNLVEWSQSFMQIDSLLPELVDPIIRDSFDMEQLETVIGVIQWCTQKEGRSRPSIKQVLRIFMESLDPEVYGFAEVMEDVDASRGVSRASRFRSYRNEVIPHSGDTRYLPSSSSTSRSYCSRSVLLESGSPQSPPGAFFL